LLRLVQGQRSANKKIRSEVQKIPKTDVKQVTCRARQDHVKRRQEYDPAKGENGDKRRRKTGEFGDLSNFPGISEVCFMAFSCPVPEERNHRITMPGIENSGYPEQVIPLPNPNLLQPLVSMETKKAIFKVDADGNTRIRDEKVALEKGDVAGKTMVPMSFMGRDEEYLKNLLWLLGISQVVLWGVGNGMLAWVCLRLRIPILCVYENELHKETIQKFLLEKIDGAMDDPAQKRFYKTDAELGVSTPGESLKTTKPKQESLKSLSEAPPKQESKKPKSQKSSSSSSSGQKSSSESSDKKSSTKKLTKKTKK